MDVEKDDRRERMVPMEPEPREVYRQVQAVSGVASGRRAQIIAATTRLIARDGVAALSTRKIAREASVNLATLHYLFSSKDDLLLAVLDAATSMVIAVLVVDVHPGGGLHAALTESFAALCALLDQVPALPLVRCEVLLYASRRPAQPASALQQQRYLDALRVCYRVAGAQGELGLIAYDDLAAVVSSSIDGLALQAAGSVPRPQQVATRANVLRALLALVPDPPSGPQACDDGSTPGRVVTLFETSYGDTGQELSGSVIAADLYPRLLQWSHCRRSHLRLLQWSHCRRSHLRLLQWSHCRRDIHLRLLQWSQENGNSGEAGWRTRQRLDTVRHAVKGRGCMG